jgi:hypothetical protein
MILHTLLKKVDIEISARATPQAVLQPAKDRLRVVEVRHTWSSDDLALQSEGAVPISHQGSEAIMSCHQSNMFPGHRLHHRRIDTCSFIVTA